MEEHGVRSVLAGDSKRAGRESGSREGKKDRAWPVFMCCGNIWR